MSHALRQACLASLLSALAFSSLHATTVIRQDTRALVRGSSDIVVGRVESVRPYFDVTRKRIYTEVTVQVGQALKGGAGGRVTLLQLGGELEGMRYSVPGSPKFEVGEEALLFVWRDLRGQAQVNGLAQGKFEIERDPTTGEAIVARRSPGLAIKEPRMLRPLRAGEVPGKITLRRMLNEVQTLLAEDGR